MPCGGESTATGQVRPPSGELSTDQLAVLGGVGDLVDSFFTGIKIDASGTIGIWNYSWLDNNPDFTNTFSAKVGGWAISGGAEISPLGIRPVVTVGLANVSLVGGGPLFTFAPTPNGKLGVTVGANLGIGGAVGYGPWQFGLGGNATITPPGTFFELDIMPDWFPGVLTK